MKSAWPGLAILLLLPVNSVFAHPPQQQQYHEEDPSNVADAARRAREQKKEQPKPARVWDNDTIPKKPGEVSVIGQTPAAAEGDDSAEGAGSKDADAAAKAATAGGEGADNAAKPANEAASDAPGAASEGVDAPDIDEPTFDAIRHDTQQNIRATNWLLRFITRLLAYLRTLLRGTVNR